MARKLDKSAIITGTAITAGQVSQSIDALTGIEAYDISISGSLNTTGSINLIGDISGSIRSTASFGRVEGTNATFSQGILTSLNVAEDSTFVGATFGGTVGFEAGFNISSGNIGAPNASMTVNHISSSGNISASGQIISETSVLSPEFKGTLEGHTNKIQMSVSNRIDINPNNTVAIRLTDSSVTLNKDTSINGDITSVTEITASGNISSSGTVIATSGSFSHLVGNSPITIGSPVNFSQPITASGNLVTSGSRKRRVRTVTLTTLGTGTLNAAQTIQPDDDIIIITGNSTSTIGVNDFTFNCTDLFYGSTNDIGRIVTIVNGSSAVGGDLILGAPNPGDTPYTINGSSTDGRYGIVCNVIGEEVNIIVTGTRTSIIYGSGI
tara:strand:+ start:2602 stop:3747 length:1146 start_codon:yes stop_codon:yes gene_type:complete